MSNSNITNSSNFVSNDLDHLKNTTAINVLDNNYQYDEDKLYYESMDYDTLCLNYRICNSNKSIPRFKSKIITRRFMINNLLQHSISINNNNIKVNHQFKKSLERRIGSCLNA